MSLETANVETFVVLWSPHQKAYHIETVGEMLEHNRQIFARQDLGDYIVLSFAETRAQAHAIADKYDKAVPRTKPPEVEPAGVVAKRLFESFKTEETEE